MGRVEKGVNCSVQGCEQSAQRSMSGSKARMASDLVVNSDKRVYLCKTHYKEWKKADKRRSREREGSMAIEKRDPPTSYLKNLYFLSDYTVFV